MQLRERTKRHVPEIPDSVLARQILAGDQQAFETLVQRYSTPLFNFICRFLGDYDLACDVLQQVFLRFYTSLPKLGTGEPFKSWLFQVAWNRCIDELRKQRPLLFSELEVEELEEGFSFLSTIPDTCPLPEEVAEQHDLRFMLCQAIETLPPKFRSIVSLRYTRDLSFMEIGNILHMPENTAKTYFQRARPLLRQALMAQLRPAVAV